MLVFTSMACLGVFGCFVVSSETQFDVGRVELYGCFLRKGMRLASWLIGGQIQCYRLGIATLPLAER